MISDSLIVESVIKELLEFGKSYGYVLSETGEGIKLPDDECCTLVIRDDEIFYFRTRECLANDRVDVSLSDPEILSKLKQALIEYK